LGFGLAAAAASALAAPATVGERIEIRPEDLPPPFATSSANNPPIGAARPERDALRLPEGFRAELFAEGLSQPRWLAAAPNGDLFVTEPFESRIRVLRDADGDSRAETVATFFADADLLRLPHGLTFHEGALYVADVNHVWRFAYEPGQLAADGPPEPITPEGAVGPEYDWHYSRNVAFAADGERFFVTVGSLGNLGEQPAPYATVQVFDADGANPRTFASGTRNPVGMAVHPDTGDLYITVVERDGYGDELPPDFVTRVEEGDFFGWPYAYAGPNPDPEFGARRPDLVAQTRIPDVLIRAHSTPLGLVFYDAGQFPEDYRGDAFVALRGSWNAAEPRGYAIARIPFEDGRPAGGYEIFADGFLVSWKDGPKAWGRPVGLAIAPDGSLYVSDEPGGTVWRIRYED
jgi:glucose/arabinose dehydrogenase